LIRGDILQDQEFGLMDQEFNWNPFADQPHNVAPKKERFRYHLRFAPGYFALLFSNIRKAIPVLIRYQKYKRDMYKMPLPLKHPFGIALSPHGRDSEEVLKNLDRLGVRNVLVRVPSWERDKLDEYKKFVEGISSRDLDVVISLLQRREDVLDPKIWAQFVDDVFSRLKPYASHFEIGHAWNRTKWGVWDFREYLKLLRPSVPLAQEHQVRLIGPAVIDFEFHLYPIVLKTGAYDKVSSLLYVDRVGAPENKQYGWDTTEKVTLLKAVVDACLKEKPEIWITEMNWPIAGTGKYSPAVGDMNVTEEEQADFLVRYFVLCLSTGYVSRIYWWQLVAPGYGLIDSRPEKWRLRPGFFAFRSLVKRLEGSLFVKKIPHPDAFIFLFRKRETQFAVCWSAGSAVEHTFSQHVSRAENRDGDEIPVQDDRVKLGPSPLYVYFHQ
jgi:hypothetical protein